MVLLIVRNKLPTLIEPGLYLGIIAYVESNEIVAKLNIKYILLVTSIRYWPIILAGISQKWINLQNEKHKNIIAYFSKAYKFIEKALEERERALAEQNRALDNCNQESVGDTQ